MSHEQAEARLVARASDGDAEAFGNLYERHLDDIYRYVYYRVSNRQDAEDLTETIFLKAWEGMATYEPQKAPFQAWLYRIAHNTVIDHYRTRKDTAPISDYPFLTDEATGPSEQVFLRQQAAQLTDRIKQLTPDYQEVLILRFVNGMTTAEAAEVLGKSNGAVRVLQHRALKALHALLAVEEVTND